MPPPAFDALVVDGRMITTSIILFDTKPAMLSHLRVFSLAAQNTTLMRVPDPFVAESM
jgi:hypothetical protein